MSHEPGRERHMTYRCEKCGRIAQESELTLNENVDEYWCEGCLQDEAHDANDQ